ncbi:MAG: hypothetical protein QM664_04850, partial [Flavihumibacter sp.]
DKMCRHSTYNYAFNNPLRFIDPDGMFSTEVIRNRDGTYTVRTAVADGDMSIYEVDENDERTGKVIGRTLTGRSFLNDQGNAVEGAVIDLSDRSGSDFLNNRIFGKGLGSFEYAWNATGGKTYDFKAEGAPGDKREWERHIYRAMSVSDVLGLATGDDGLPTIATARDVGNVAAGYVAGDNGLNWAQARFAFDLTESWQNARILIEGQTTQNAQLIGYKIGSDKFKKEHPVNSFIYPKQSPFPPK